MIEPDRTLDAVVVGGGFGGLGAALRLAEAGQDVLLLERVGYLGGCACTFEHGGDQFEGGATLFAGLGDGELFGRWIAKYRLDVQVLHLERPVELRAGADVVVQAHRDRALFVASFLARPGAPRAALERFFALQARVAGVLWELLDEPGLLPPFTARSVLRHVRRSWRYAALLPLVGRSLGDVLARFGLSGYAPLVRWLDAQCQITVQCPAREAEALFALAALDYHHRGATHVIGGVGVLAEALGRAIVMAGGRVQRRSAVSRIERDGDVWLVTARGTTYRTRSVFLNVLPQVAESLVRGVPARAFTRLAERVRQGWGAAALFRIASPPPGADSGPLHLELVDDPAQPYVEGNHVFLSIGAESEGVSDPATRRATISTHVDLGMLRLLDDDAQRAHIDAVHARMRQTLARRAPEWEQVRRELTASPRTYARWVGRSDGSDGSVGGWAGGVPRRAGIGAYRDLFARTPAPGLALVGDSVFPGQSILAAALGGVRAVERSLGQRPLSQSDALGSCPLTTHVTPRGSTRADARAPSCPPYRGACNSGNP